MTEFEKIVQSSCLDLFNCLYLRNVIEKKLSYKQGIQSFFFDID